MCRQREEPCKGPEEASVWPVSRRGWSEGMERTREEAGIPGRERVSRDLESHWEAWGALLFPVPQDHQAFTPKPQVNALCLWLLGKGSTSPEERLWMSACLRPEPLAQLLSGLALTSTRSVPGLSLWSREPPDRVPGVRAHLVLTSRPAEAHTRLPGGWGRRVGPAAVPAPGGRGRGEGPPREGSLVTGMSWWRQPSGQPKAPL